MSGIRQSYQKQWLSVQDQLEKLKKRGLIISDEAMARNALRSHGYYRLSGYWHVFRQVNLDKISDQFQVGTTFEQVLALAEFDKSIRNIFFSMLESIEIGFRTRVAHIVGKTSPSAHLDPSTYGKKWRESFGPRQTKRNFSWVKSEISKYERRSQDEFVKHFRAKYEPPMPIWITVEVWDFRFLSRIYEGLTFNLKQELSQSFGLADQKVLGNWMHSLSLVRNITAHHGRLWNRPLVQQIALPQPGEVSLFDAIAPDQRPKSTSRIYGAAVAGQHLLKQLHMNPQWAQEFASCIQTFPTSPHMSPEKNMGFPDQWQKHEDWS